MKVSRRLLMAGLIIVAPSAGLRMAYDVYKAHVGTRILFVGNSFTFVGNLPAVFASLSKANGYPVSTEMLVQSGAVLTDRIADGSVQRMLDLQHFDYVVLQERGGTLLCGLSRENSVDSCEISRRAHAQLAKMIQAHGAEPVVLGTYPLNAQVGPALEANERFVANGIGAAYAPISDKYLAATAKAPSLNWLAPDGGHPGHDLTLLDAVALYETIFKERPRASTLTVHGPIYDISTAIFDLDWPRVPAAANEYTYEAPRVARVITLAASP